jgi:hypothetical protein
MKTSKTGLAILLALSIFASCSKNDNNTVTPPSHAFVSVVNASPGTALYNVYADSTNIYTGNTLAYGSTTGIAGGSPYETINSGTQSIRLSANGTDFPLDSAINFTGNGYYTVFAYDTANGSGKLRTLVLNDNLTSLTDEAQVRFLNLSPNSPALNVWLINTDPTIKDTTTLNNIMYVGSSVINSDSLSAFKTIEPGTYKVHFNSASSKTNLFTSDSVTFVSGRIYTLYAKGYINGVNNTDSLGIGVITNK